MDFSAMKCPTCGKKNPEGQKFCGDCGSIIPLPPPPIQPEQPVYPSARLLAAVAVVVVIIFAIILAALVVIPSYASKEATFNISVHSNHIISTIEVYLYLGWGSDLTRVADFQLTPGQTVTNTYVYHWTGSSSHSVNIMALASYGELGNTEDQSILVAQDHGTYSVSLTV